MDVLFRNILKDPEIGTYDSYVLSLTKDLQEAMAIAQTHADKEQGRQAELYNRRAKGKSISAGDRVLVSNKRGRGKQKTADRWESTIYTVVSVNASTHTYRIRNPMTGQERVVHRNLLMLVNFLPVDVDSVSDHTSMSSCENESSDITDTDGLMSVVSEGVPESRTQEWVGNLTTVSVDNHAGYSSPEDVLCMSGVSEHAGSVPPQSQTELSPDHSRTCASLADAQSVHTHSTHSAHSDHAHSPGPHSIHSNSSTIQRVRTRVGRIVKPVDRLLYQMSKQGVVSDASQFIGKVSKSVFRVFD